MIKINVTKLLQLKFLQQLHMVTLTKIYEDPRLHLNVCVLLVDVSHSYYVNTVVQCLLQGDF